MGRIDAWDEWPIFGFWDELSLYDKKLYDKSEHELCNYFKYKYKKPVAEKKEKKRNFTSRQKYFWISIALGVLIRFIPNKIKTILKMRNNRGAQTYG